jgi:hypothetical protein
MFLGMNWLAWTLRKLMESTESFWWNLYHLETAQEQNKMMKMMQIDPSGWFKWYGCKAPQS